MPADLSMRASDGDREGVVQLLRDQTALGRLTVQEFDDRMGVALTARTWGDLHKVTSDLPVSLPFPEVDHAADTTDRRRARNRGITWSDVGYWALFSAPFLLAVVAWILHAPAALLLVFAALVLVVFVGGAS